MSAETITVPKTQYNQLKRQALAYRKFTARFFDCLVKDSVKNIVDDFRNTNLYTEDFLKDLEAGFCDSSYSHDYENKSAKTKVRKISR